jgi:hypothetical protein
MLRYIRSPWAWAAAAVAAFLLFFSTIHYEDIRLKQKITSAVPFAAVSPGMLYEVDGEHAMTASFPLCRLTDAESSRLLSQPHHKVFYNWVGETLPVLPLLGGLFSDDPPDVRISMAYVVETLDPDFAGDIRKECEDRAIAAISRGMTICVVDAVVRMANGERDLFGVRFKPHAFAPNWTDWSDPPLCRLGWAGHGILPLRQAFISDSSV